MRYTLHLNIDIEGVDLQDAVQNLLEMVREDPTVILDEETEFTTIKPTTISTKWVNTHGEA